MGDIFRPMESQPSRAQFISIGLRPTYKTSSFNIVVVVVVVVVVVITVTLWTQQKFLVYVLSRAGIPLEFPQFARPFPEQV